MRYLETAKAPRLAHQRLGGGLLRPLEAMVTARTSGRTPFDTPADNWAFIGLITTGNQLLIAHSNHLL
jgi:hypothetical protein